MLKIIVMCCAMLMLNACVAQDEQYYRLNPVALQKAIKSCPQKKPAGLSCEKLEDLAVQVNQLAYELQRNPQRFGQKILALQQELAKQHDALHQDSQQPELAERVKNNQQQLAEYLAIVRWLESPES